jgi:hypothetical protein
MSDIKDTKAYSINDFLNWFDNSELTLSPKYQRNSVWNNSAKSYLMDTILRGYPIPQIFIRQIIDTNTRKTTREIIDGQQRLRSIIEFTQDAFPILKTHNSNLSGKYFSDLNDDLKEKFLSFNISTEIIKLKEDSKIYEMFARLNTNNMALNKQELRNAEFWGDFKVYIYKKSADFKEFLIDNNVFKDKEFARMVDVELINSLVINLIDGIVTESPAKIDSYYKKFDATFPEIDENEIRFNKIMSIFETIFENPIFETKRFNKKGYIYTLFSYLNEQFYNKLDLCIDIHPSYSLDNISTNLNTLTNKLMNFELELNRVNSKDFELDESDENAIKLINFEKYHRTRTTSLQERKERIKILADFLNPSK